MPLVGFLIKQRLLNHATGEIEERLDPWRFADAIEAADNGIIEYPPTLLRLLSKDVRDDETPSASSLAGCLRRFELKRRIDYYRTPESMLPAAFGTAFHAALAAVEKPEGTVSEQKLSLDFSFFELPEGWDRITLTGTVDERHTLIEDWKTKRFLSPEQQIDEAHDRQVNVYNLLDYATRIVQDPEAVPLEHCRITYLDQGTVVTRTAPLAPIGPTYDWCRDRLLDWAGPVSRGELPAPLEGWDRVDTATKFKRGIPKPGPQECYWCECRTACWEAMGASIEDDDA